MLDPAALPGYLTAVLLITLAPGVDNAFIVAVVADRGTRAGVLSAVGIALGVAAHIIAASFGLALFLRSTPAALTVIRLAGAAYLAVLAVRTLRSARASGLPERAAPPAGAHLLGRAMLVNLTNPKVILFFAAFLPQFAHAGYGPTAVQFLTLGAIFLVTGLTWDGIVAVGAGRLSGALRSGGRAATALGVSAGLTFAIIALVMAVEALSGV